MAETDILNPANWVALGMPFNPNPSYGFSRRMSNNRLLQRPRLGPFLSRDVGNAGHVFPLTWVNTDLTTAQRVTKFYHDFKHGYFTFLNPDWSGRNFVGRFTSEPEAVQTANGKWTIQGVMFEEVPTARMLAYPNDWANDGHPLNVVDDFFRNYSPSPLVAFMQGGWLYAQYAFPGTTTGLTATAAATFAGINATPATGDWAQVQYTGWGFRMTFPLAASNGCVVVYLDGVPILDSLDLSSGASMGVSGVPPVVPSVAIAPGWVTVTVTNLPLDIHLVKLAYGGPSVAGGSAMIFPPLEYIY